MAESKSKTSESAVSRVSEEAFIAGWIDRREAGTLRLVYAMSLVTHAGSIVVLPWIVHETTRAPLLWLHCVTLLSLCVGALLHKKSPRLHRDIMTLMIWVVSAGYFTLLAFCVYELHSFRDIMIANSGCIAYLVAGVILYSGSRRSLYAFAGFAAAAGPPAAYGADGGAVWGGILGAILIFMLIVRRAFDQVIKREGQQEYRFRRLVAPAHIVRRSLDNSETLRETFKPELKFCVCIASDWRDYQAISANLSPSQLTMTLNEYYALCERILVKCLPTGNYYTDWIADELFVVLYSEGKVTDSMLIDAALRFSTELIHAKVEFARIYSLPKAIDVGISAGPALIGLMGPDAHKKATALGEVPGRSRRFQGAGKLLRKKRGEQDRVIFGRECLMRITSPYPVNELALSPNESVRDVIDRELFFIEPEFQAETKKDEVA